MTRFAYARSILAAALFLLLAAVGTVSAQSFEDGTAGPWNFSDDFYSTMGEITDERAYDGTYSAKITLRTTGNNKAAFRTFPSGITISEGDVLQFWVYVESSQTDSITALKPLIEYGPDFSNNTFDSGFYTPPGSGGDEFKTDEWHMLTYEVTAEADGENLLTAGIELAGTSDDVDPTIYVDDVTFAGSPLPVELTAFDATLDGRDATVQWQTASETNNAGFDLQHKAPSSASFEDVTFVDGAGTTTQPQNYSYELTGLSSGTHQFRLRQEDFDGSSTLSDPITVEIGAEQTELALTGANPFRTTTRVRFSSTSGGPVQLTLYDVLGREVRSVFDGRLSAESAQRATIDGSDLSAGVYFLRLNTPTDTKTQRLTIAE